MKLPWWSWIPAPLIPRPVCRWLLRNRPDLHFWFGLEESTRGPDGLTFRERQAKYR